MKAIAYCMAALSGAALLAVGPRAVGHGHEPVKQPHTKSNRAVTAEEIVSDQSGAKQTDPTLVNAWGLAFDAAGVAWVAANATGVANAYDPNGNQVNSPITLPSPDGPAAPTGAVSNSDAHAFKGDRLIFVTEDGTIAGAPQANQDGQNENDGKYVEKGNDGKYGSERKHGPDGNGAGDAGDGEQGQAVTRIDHSADEAIYKGVTIGKDSSGQLRLFATDFHGAKVDVFDSSYAPVEAGGFVDPQLPDGFAPFNIEAVQGALIVTFALQDEDQKDDVAGPGNGVVDLFDTDGSLLARLISGEELNAPWGIALSPASFSAAPDRLLVGNFGDGKIHVYDLDLSKPERASAKLDGALQDGASDDLVIDGLWALKFAPDAGGFSSSELYYTAGPADETHGVFGRIEPSVPQSGQHRSDMSGKSSY